ncbi:hypothetical protein NITLEN_40075 [Nitrospira lenta]|uniref:Uncharacterized protein n=1 Tax=Nitrospira lenta TaxID=1436998 RepID=A0A330L7E5_9BACT|nr:hypothetical protein NITLEN_40075 [Nitrospira lenta]
MCTGACVKPATNQFSSWCAEKLARILIGTAIFCTATISVSQAEAPDSVSIRALLESAVAKNTHTVTVSGIVKHMKPFPPFTTKLCRAVYGSYTFMLEDESGSIPIEVYGVCGASSGVPQVSDGQRVQVVGEFLVQHQRDHKTPIIYTISASVAVLESRPAP